MKSKFATACVLAAVVLGCSSSSSGGGPGRSGVAGSKTVVSLSSAEAGQLCDWMANLMGGYGKKKTTNCDGGTVTVEGPTTQADCMAPLSTIPKTCAATVTQVEDCETALASADLCSSSGEPPACAPLFDKSCQPATGDASPGG